MEVGHIDNVITHIQLWALLQYRQWAYVGSVKQPAALAPVTSPPATALADTRSWPGLAVAVAGAGLAMGANALMPGASPMLSAILLGAAWVNLASGSSGIPAIFGPGLAVAARRLLRLGVVFLGLQLVIGDIVALGWAMVVGVVAVVAGTMGVALLLGRWLRIAPSQTLLIASGFSICGAAAVAGVDGVLAKRDESETATAVALVVLFGTGMIAVLPTLVGWFGMDARTAGLWIGGSVHEVAQVVAAAGIVGPETLNVAVVVKLARVLMLAPVLAVISWRQRAQIAASARPDRALPPLVPLFVVGFLAMVAARSLGWVPDVALELGKGAQTWLLAAAMFALGTSAHWVVLKKSGGRPVLLAGLATVVVTTLAGGLALLAR
ncbi:MAG TPA: putative sulfate exporter family transporter [Propionibacteriaceae bacterium]|nr:putative sulfate exporter family transporter [Micropruina sp.]HBX82861.1 putative sulfate exporter family transporter [Propionibacteriaceae bacterium]HBY23390.1 putative sulfate exporter family transporter [Propionibacteriaceae bacterium]